MYILDIDKIKEGDILLTSQKGLVSKAVRKFTNGEYSHAILCVGHGSYIHSDLQGVHSGNLQRLMFESPDNVKVLRPNNQSLSEKASLYARSQIGKEYSINEAIRAKVNKKNSTVNKQFCSRLVAQSYEYAGEAIVKNSAYCTPEDINRSSAFSQVDGAIRTASEEEFEFAEGFNPLQRQTEITNKILSEARRLTGVDIQSLEQLSQYVVKNPLHSDAIVEVFKNSGYLTMWEHDLKKNPWRYNSALFLELKISKDEKLKLAEMEIESAKQQIKLYSHNYTAYQYLSLVGMSSYIRMEMELYKINIMNDRLEAAKYVLAHT